MKLLEKSCPNTEIWVHIPLNLKNCWEIYNSFRMNIKRTNCFGVLLEISEDLPDKIERWFGENIKSVYLKTELFVLNQKGLPVLIKSHQDLIKKLIYFKINFMIKGVGNEDLSEYRKFLCYLFSKLPEVIFVLLREKNHI